MNLKLKSKLFLLGCAFSISSCKNENSTFEKRYEGFWAETTWVYEFRKDGTFTFNCQGHYGCLGDSGIYLVKDSIIYLNPESDYSLQDQVLSRQMKITSSNCIRDHLANYYCDNLDLLNSLSDDENDFRSRAEIAIDTLSIVREEKERIISYAHDKGFNLSVQYHGIFKVKGKEFRQFSFNIFEGHNDQPLLFFLVSKKPFKVYGMNPSLKPLAEDTTSSHN